MDSIKRVEEALAGKKPDRVPIAACFGEGYILKLSGRDVREKFTCTAEEWIEAIEFSFLRHGQADVFRLQPGKPASAGKNIEVDRLEKYWRISNLETGEKWGLLPGGSPCGEDGSPQARPEREAFPGSRINSEDDIERVIGKAPGRDDIAAGGKYGPLEHLYKKYPDRHLSSQIMCPFSKAVEYCGGYVEGLLLMKENPRLFHGIMRRCSDIQLALLEAAGENAHSVWFTSYYTGADTISPRVYRDEIFQYDFEILSRAGKKGLYTLNWYLGDLLPNLETVMKLPLDAIVLEQGRKSYRSDPGEIRRLAGRDFCLFGYAMENDFVSGNFEGLESEFKRQANSAGLEGAFIAGTPVMPENARPEAVDFYFNCVLRLGGCGF